MILEFITLHLLTVFLFMSSIRLKFFNQKPYYACICIVTLSMDLAMGISAQHVLHSIVPKWYTEHDLVCVHISVSGWEFGCGIQLMETRYVKQTKEVPPLPKNWTSVSFSSITKSLFCRHLWLEWHMWIILSECFLLLEGSRGLLQPGEIDAEVMEKCWPEALGLL